eukprot:gene5176-7407_t
MRMAGGPAALAASPAGDAAKAAEPAAEAGETADPAGEAGKTAEGCRRIPRQDAQTRHCASMPAYRRGVPAVSSWHMLQVRRMGGNAPPGGGGS